MNAYVIEFLKLNGKSYRHRMFVKKVNNPIPARSYCASVRAGDLFICYACAETYMDKVVSAGVVYTGRWTYPRGRLSIELVTIGEPV